MKLNGENKTLKRGYKTENLTIFMGREWISSLKNRFVLNLMEFQDQILIEIYWKSFNKQIKFTSHNEIKCTSQSWKNAFSTEKMFPMKQKPFIVFIFEMYMYFKNSRQKEWKLQTNYQKFCFDFKTRIN